MEVKKIPITSDYDKSKIKGYDISFIKDDKELKIVFGGNGDLYWMLRQIKTSDMNEEMNEVYNNFYITKENPVIYRLFDELYNDILNCNIFRITELDQEMYTKSELKKKQKKKNELNEWNRHKRDLLVEEDKIKWHSDEQMFEYANVVTISKQEEGYLLEFTIPDQPEEELLYRLPGTISIRFRNSGSTYDPFNIVFMRMYQELQKYDREEEQRIIDEQAYHQITLEEYKLTLGKK